MKGIVGVRISIFGIGYVGAVSSACLADLGHEVIAVDVAADKVDNIRHGQSPIVETGIDRLIAQGVEAGRLTATTDAAAAVANSDVSFISVGTPSAPDGSVSMKAVRQAIASVGQGLRTKNGKHAIVMRSTVPPGTAESCALPILEQESGRRHGEDFSYYSNPEFLREGSAVRDFHAPPFTLIGARDGDDAAVLREIYAPLNRDIHVTGYRVAESAKYLANVYHAVKLAFANEAGAILASHGVDAREAFRIFCQDRVLNISAAYLQPGFAFGGSCLPTDVRSFMALADQNGVSAPFLRQLLPSNEINVERTFEAITRHGRQRVSLFGLAFKPGTDDLRESPFVHLAERLIGRGYDLRIFDRSVHVARLMGTNRIYIEREIPHIERLMVGSPAEALEGSRLAVIGHVGREDQDALLGSLRDHSVLDLAGLPALRSHDGIAYQGLCW
jgi:GDP-mannose 6-dehydrogenase